MATMQDYFDGLDKGRPIGSKDGCYCWTCSSEAERRYFIVCAICGNKRCPGAKDHRNACTNSNEPGQKGSLYE